MGGCSDFQKKEKYIIAGRAKSRYRKYLISMQGPKILLSVKITNGIKKQRLVLLRVSTVRVRQIINVKM